jgi:uncharacterized membrane protein
MENYPLLHMFWTMFLIFCFVVWFWLIVSIFADNFRRTDHSGMAKAGWTVLIIFVPVIGILLYMIARPQMTEQDQQLISAYEKQQSGMAGLSPAEEIEKLNKLKSDGAISADEYEVLKKKALA